GQGRAGMDRVCRCQDRLHRAGQSLGEWLHRELQRAPSRRAARRRNLLLTPRGPNRHRELAAPLQHDQAARLTWIQATGTGGIRARLRRVAGCAIPSGSAGHAGETANLKLTFHLDHSEGADHKVEHRNLIKELSDEQLEAMVAYIETSPYRRDHSPAGGRTLRGMRSPGPTAVSVSSISREDLLCGAMDPAPPSSVPPKVLEPVGRHFGVLLYSTVQSTSAALGIAAHRPMLVPLDEWAANSAATIEIIQFPCAPPRGGLLDFHNRFLPLLQKLGRKPFLELSI